MRGVASINARLVAGGLFVALAAVTLAGSPVAAQSMVGAVVCEASSTMTITAPESDSVLTQPTLTIEGQVTQASQIEIEVDGAFDSIIPLTVGQSSYTGTVHLSLGTHTVKATAISLCPGANGTASVVVTHERGAAAPSTGGNVDTSVDSGAGQATDGTGSAIEASDTGVLGFIQNIMAPLEPLALWLNIGDLQESDVSRMPIGRAVLFTAGLYLAIIGLAPAAFRRLAANRFVTSFFSEKLTTKKAVPRRAKVLSRISRMVGVILVISSLAFL